MGLNGLATLKMMDYARDISKWVSEPLPESYNFVVIQSYIDRNKEKYQKAVQQWKLEQENYDND